MLSSINCCSKKVCNQPVLPTFNPRRYKKRKEHWHDIQAKRLATDKAMAHYDDFYKSVYRHKWPSIRLALLSPQKYVALLNNLGDVEKTSSHLTNIGAIDLGEMFRVYKQGQSEKNDASNRERDLNKIFAMDRMMESKIDEQKSKDLEGLIPEESKDRLRDILDSKSPAGDENDDRLVDPEMGLDGSSLHDFMPVTKLKGMEDYIGEGEHYEFYKATSQTNVKVEKEYVINFPTHLRVHSFERGNITYYSPPRRGSTGVYDYFLMDGSSLLPVLALGLKSGDHVLDMCAAPGGKSLAIFQTLLPRVLVCNDSSTSRVRRLESVFRQFLYDYDTKWKDTLMITQMNGAAIDEMNFYDKILVDAPCTNDRLSLHEKDNNIFKPSRVKERLRLPELQATLLTRALELLRPGGTCVYSTCSLSPVQNEGVVAMALRTLQEQGMQFTIKDLNPALECMSDFFIFAKGVKYGHLVMPFLPLNFGPMYFCKIMKDP